MTSEAIAPYKHADEIGDEHGRWTIVSESFKMRDKGSKRFHVCICICGTTKIVRRGDLLTGDSSSCGCYNLEELSNRGLPFLTKELRPTWKAYRRMLWRCTDCLPGYEDIEVCARWQGD